MPLQSKDIYVLVGTMRYERGLPEARLAAKLHIAPSEVHYSLQRLDASYLYSVKQHYSSVSNTLEFAEHGLKYVFPVSPGPPALGLPTLFSCPGLQDHLTFDNSVYGTPVWADGEQGEHQYAYGYSIDPLHKNVPTVSKSDEKLYEIFSLLDILRQRSAREFDIAFQLLKERLKAL